MYPSILLNRLTNKLELFIYLKLFELVNLLVIIRAAIFFFRIKFSSINFISRFLGNYSSKSLSNNHSSKFTNSNFISKFIGNSVISIFLSNKCSNIFISNNYRSNFFSSDFISNSFLKNFLECCIYFNK